MTYEEALKELKHEIDMLPNEPPSDFVGNENVWFKEHKTIIDAHNKAIEALEKQIPKKTKNIRFSNDYRLSEHNIKEADCRFCGKTVTGNYYGEFCGCCGQAIDWGE